MLMRVSKFSQNFFRNSIRLCSSKAEENFRIISPMNRKLKTVPKTVELQFTHKGETFPVMAKVGDTIYEVITNADSFEIDGFGACEGTLSCSTCHVIFEKSVYDSLPDKPKDTEMDMLDLAFDLTDTSRLGCQVCVSRAMEGAKIEIPASFNDVRPTE